ncbi:MAG: Holliday junction resolvase RuvX [Bacilli bacterium]|jgi:putative Holliday junction resolvase|nr:Holliday junction resolvase RuvX [Bacilli bacterium]
MRYLGLDLGSKTLGVALSDVNNIIASPLKTIYFKEGDYTFLINELEKLVRLYKVEKIILGFPKNMDNTIGPRGEQTLLFKEEIENKLGLEVVLEDERLTTKVVDDVLIKADLSRRKRKKVVDKLAANVILQSYLNRKEGC